MKKLWSKPELESLLIGRFAELKDVRVHSCSFSKSTGIVDLEILVQEKLESDVELIKFLEDLTKTEVKVKCIKNHFDEDFLSIKILKYFQEDNGFLRNKISAKDFKIEQNGKECIVTFLGDVNFCGYINVGVVEPLEMYLYRSFIMDFKVTTFVDREVEEVKAETVHKASRAVKVDKLEPFMGKPEGDTPAFICDIDGEYDRGIVCGIVTNLEEKTKKNPKQIGKRKINWKYYTFDLTDMSGKVGCMAFPSLAMNKKMEMIEGMQVVVAGQIKAGRMGEFMVMARTITFCHILTTDGPPNKLLKDEPLYYDTVKPEPVVVYKQDNILESAKVDDVTKLMGKTIVVFDIETTGLSPIHNRIVELGAVKIVDGVITDKFSSLVNPEVMMDQRNMSIHGITNEAVRNSPKIDKVIVDFYKFSYGSILCGHNSKGFDIPFIRENAKKVGFDFFNKQIDTLELAIRYVKGTSNNKLGTLCQHFGIVNEKAHRAYEDAIATGQLLIRMLSEIEEMII